MSDNKKYYYLKLKDNYFEQDNIKIIEAMENGYIYSLIILKLYLKSCKTNGQLMMTERIPYNPEKLEILAKVLNHDISHLRDAIKIGIELDLITILDSSQIWMTDIQNFIGHSSSEGDRKRLYRAKISGQKVIMDKCPPKRPPEKELEIKLKKEKELNSANEFNIFWNTYDYKNDKDKCFKKWQKLTKKEKAEITEKLPAYIQSTPDKKYRKYPLKYLNNKAWQNEIIPLTDKQKQQTAAEKESPFMAELMKEPDIDFSKVDYSKMPFDAPEVK